MAKIYNVLRYVDDIKPNRFTDDTKVQWLNEVEGYIQTEVMMLALSEVVQYDPEAHMHTELLVKPPHDKLYAMYLCAMVDFANGEYDKYTNTMQMYNEFLGEYIKWYTMHYRPADGGCVDEGYYLTAYQLAVIRGFEGSIDEWLESLRGKTAYEQAVEQGYRGTPEEFGRNQAGFAENAQMVQNLSERAAAAASSAAGSADNASSAANAAANNAAAALTHARSANDSANLSAQYASGANSAKDTAATAAASADASAAEARSSESNAAASANDAKKSAEDAAKNVTDALTEAKNSGEFDGEPGKPGNPGVFVGEKADMPEGTVARFNPNGKAIKIPPIDDTLTKAGYAADAAAVGEKLNQQSNAIADTVKTTPQNLTSGQKAQICKNIGAAEAVYREVNTKYTRVGGDGDATVSLTGYIDENGNFVSTLAFACSDYIDLSGVSSINGKVDGIASAYPLAFYDAKKQFLSGIGFGQDWTAFIGDFDIPEGAAYLRITFNASATNYIIITRTKTVNDYIDVVDRTYNDIVAASVLNAYINASGVIESTSSWSVSDYERITPNCTIAYKLYGTPSTSLFAFYDKDCNFISNIAAGTEPKLYEGDSVFPPDNAYYLRYAVLLNNTSQFVRITAERTKTTQTHVERILADNPLCGKILTATGDSITATVSNRKYAGYAKMIATKNRMTYESKAIWGATVARGIEKSQGCILDTLEQMREDADYIVLSGGANDFYYLSSGDETLGEVTSGYDAALDPTTFCGAVESMCKTAINRWTEGKIIYVITHRMLDIKHEDLQSWVDTLILILEKWGITYVDLWHDMPSLMLPALKNKYTSMGNVEYDGTGDGLHPNENGYKMFYVPRVEAKLRGI